MCRGGRGYDDRGAREVKVCEGGPRGAREAWFGSRVERVCRVCRCAHNPLTLVEVGLHGRTPTLGGLGAPAGGIPAPDSWRAPPVPEGWSAFRGRWPTRKDPAWARRRARDPGSSTLQWTGVLAGGSAAGGARGWGRRESGEGPDYTVAAAAGWGRWRAGPTVPAAGPGGSECGAGPGVRDAGPGGRRGASGAPRLGAGDSVLRARGGCRALMQSHCSVWPGAARRPYSLRARGRGLREGGGASGDFWYRRLRGYCRFLLRMSPGKNLSL